MICVGGDEASISSWQFKRSEFEALEPVVKLTSFKPMVQAQETEKLQDMSVLDLMQQLEKKGWKHEFWSNRKKERPPPVNVKRPILVWYTKGDQSHLENPVVSTKYLLALADIEHVKVDFIAHFEKDGYYKSIFSAEHAQKAAKLVKFDDDVGIGLSDLDDIEPKPKKSKLGMKAALQSCASGSAGETSQTKVKRTRTTSSKSFWWGSALFTHSTSSKGMQCFQATCHRVHSHNNLLGRRTGCRKRININGQVTEEVAIRFSPHFHP